jgi:hypothetical protein
MSVFQFSALCGLLAALPACAYAEDIAPTALNSLSSAPAGLKAAQVMDQNGHVLGKVEQVQTDQDGKLAALSFRAQDGRLVVIGAAATSYDGKTLVTSNDQPQIVALIGTPIATRTAAK